MSKWIALRIMDTKDKAGVVAAQQKYKLYFLVTNHLHIYKEETDKTLKKEGYEDCIASKEE